MGEEQGRRDKSRMGYLIPHLSHDRDRMQMGEGQRCDPPGHVSNQTYSGGATGDEEDPVSDYGGYYGGH